MWDTKATNWEANFFKLKKFSEKHGHCSVPFEGARNRLGRWVNAQRKQYRKGSLSEERIKRLEEIGFSWNTKTDRWEANFQALTAFKKKHGHCDVPSKTPTLGRWCEKQRLAHKRRSLPKDKAQRLEALGFIWEVREARWQAKFVELQAFAKKQGHCKVPISHPTLGSWTNVQRTLYNKGALPRRRVRQLDSLGFVWAA